MGKRVTFDRDKFLDLVSDWHLDDEIDEDEARKYAHSMLDRLQREAKPEPIKVDPRTQQCVDNVSYSLASAVLTFQENQYRDELAILLRRHLAPFLQHYKNKAMRKTREADPPSPRQT